MSITEKHRFYDFAEVSFSEDNYLGDLSKGFIIKLHLKSLPNAEQRKPLFRCPFFAVTSVKLHKEKDREKLSRLEAKDRAFIYADNDGFASFLELSATFRSEYTQEIKTYTLDLPLNIFDVIGKECYFLYDGVVFGWIVGGEMVNLDYPFGELIADEHTEAYQDDCLQIAVSNEISRIKKEWKTEKLDRSINFYSPRGYNAWAGDVVNFYHNGYYHLLYLYDRHHHSSRFGGGAHTMRHLITKDLIDWEECEPLVALDEQWKSVGTGTMFFRDGKYYFSHGWHTSRTIPQEHTGTPFLQEEFEKTGAYQGVSRKELQEKGLYPSGATYSVSEDGIHFRPSEVQFHVAENPSIYMENGGFVLYAGYDADGVWEAEDIDGPWIKKAEQAVPKSIMRPTTECTCKFSLNGYQYLIMGGTGYWKTPKNSDEFNDEAADGYDVYDGLAYPMVTVTDTGRMIMGGWLYGYGWGSVIVHRELIQGDDGRLYMRWLDELTPKKQNLKAIPFRGKALNIEERKSYYVEMSVKPNINAKIGVRFCGETDCMLWLDSEKERIQISKIDKEKKEPEELAPAYISARENIGNKEWGKSGLPKHGVDFSLARADVLKNEYKLKIQLYYEKKFDSVILDCEIGGKRTLVSNRVDQRFTELHVFAENAKMSEIEAYEL